MPRAESDNETPIRAFVNVSLYGELEIHVQLASISGVYGGTESEGVKLELSVSDAEKLRAQLDGLLAVYDRHSL